MIPKIDHSRFNAILSDRFPQIDADIDESSRGLLHLEVAELARATQRAIDGGNLQQVKEYFTFVDEVFQYATPDVVNAINVSFLENLNFSGRNQNRAPARKLLTPRLAKALDELEAYLDDLLDGSSKESAG